mgnify:CR=1 FL=1
MKFKKINKLNEELDALDEIKQKRAKEYRKLANLSDEETITEDKIDRWALRTASKNLHSSEEDIREAILESAIMNEDVTLGQAVKDMEAEGVVSTDDDASTIEKVLDRSLTVALRRNKRGQHGDYPNVLFTGPAGTGKTAIINQWAAKNNINLFNVKAAGLDVTDLRGAIAPSKRDDKTADRLASTEFDALERPRSVLFLDEYNRASKEVRTPLFELANNHIIPDVRVPGGERFLPNFLFTVAAVNPSDSHHDVIPLDAAETSRFRNVKVGFQPSVFLKWINKSIDRDLADSDDEEEIKELTLKKGLINTLVGDPKFEFDSQEDMDKGVDKLGDDYKPLNYRSLTALLQNSDGTKEDFLDLWSEHVNPLKKNMAEDILDDYEDVDDKANQALAGGTESEVFGKKKSNMQKIFDRFGTDLDLD